MYVSLQAQLASASLPVQVSLSPGVFFFNVSIPQVVGGLISV